MLNPWLARKGMTTDRLIARGLPLSFAVLAGIIIAGPAAGAGAWALFCVTFHVRLAGPAGRGHGVSRRPWPAGPCRPTTW